MKIKVKKSQLALALAFISGTVLSVGVEATAVGPKIPPQVISSKEIYPSKYMSIDGHRIRYIDEGKGPVVVFIHGNPTSSYIWRNILPTVAENHRVIAVDLLGMGRSDKPKVRYGFEKELDIVDKFIQQLNVEDVAIIGHDWGATIGFAYSASHPDNVRAIAFMEGVLPPIFPRPSYESMGPQMGEMFRSFKDEKKGRELIVDQNIFIESILPGFVNRQLDEEAWSVYRSYYLDPRDREAVLAWPRDIPIAGQPASTAQWMQKIEHFMKATDKPLLLIYAQPGVLVNNDVLSWYKGNLKNLDAAYVGQGLHFIQEDQPTAIAEAIVNWLH